MTTSLDPLDSAGQTWPEHPSGQPKGIPVHISELANSTIAKIMKFPATNIDLVCRLDSWPTFLQMLSPEEIVLVDQVFSIYHLDDQIAFGDLWYYHLFSLYQNIKSQIPIKSLQTSMQQTCLKCMNNVHLHLKIDRLKLKGLPKDQALIKEYYTKINENCASVKADHEIICSLIQSVSETTNISPDCLQLLNDFRSCLVITDKWLSMKDPGKFFDFANPLWQTRSDIPAQALNPKKTIEDIIYYIQYYEAVYHDILTVKCDVNGKLTELLDSWDNDSINKENLIIDIENFFLTTSKTLYNSYRAKQSTDSESASLLRLTYCMAYDEFLRIMEKKVFTPYFKEKMFLSRFYCKNVLISNMVLLENHLNSNKASKSKKQCSKWEYSLIKITQSVLATVGGKEGYQKIFDNEGFGIRFFTLTPSERSNPSPKFLTHMEPTNFDEKKSTLYDEPTSAGFEQAIEQLPFGIAQAARLHSSLPKDSSQINALIIPLETLKNPELYSGINADKILDLVIKEISTLCRFMIILKCTELLVTNESFFLEIDELELLPPLIVDYLLFIIEMVEELKAKKQIRSDSTTKISLETTSLSSSPDALSGERFEEEPVDPQDSEEVRGEELPEDFSTLSSLEIPEDGDAPKKFHLKNLTRRKLLKELKKRGLDLNCFRNGKGSHIVGGDIILNKPKKRGFAPGTLHSIEVAAQAAICST